MGNRAKNVIVGCAAFAVLAITSEIHALTLSGTGPGNNPGQVLQASATFTLSNMDLIVTLSNTGTFDPNDVPDILTGIFFTIGGDPTLTPLSAEVAPGSLVIGHRLPTGFGGDIGAEWAYRNELTGAPLGANEGISSTTMKFFGKKNLFPGNTIKGVGSFGGIQFGLTTAFDTPANDRNIKNQALVDNSAVFTFGGLPENFALSDITNVTFQYGTTFKDPEFAGFTAAVPEPATITLVGAGLLGMLSLKRRKTLR